MESMADEALLKAIAKKVELMEQRTSQIEERLEYLIRLIEKGSATKGEDQVTYSDPEIVEAFWRCSPRQHAIIQMIVNGFTSAKIANRIGTTHEGAKSQIRYLYDRLGVRGKMMLEDKCAPLWKNADEETYLESARIPKDWFFKYGNMDREEAIEQDEYYTAICTTNYRVHG